MVAQDKNWFQKLSERRNNTANTLMDDFAISNMWDSVVEKYSDQAHFIYELLQNANDAKATKSSFELSPNGLYFKHNGIKNFWVSNPESERIDQQNNNLGDINAITAVAQSNKKSHDTVGKFGVGFKAVFQYTETPHIYDPNFQFKISKFIVPIELEKDLENRKKDETIFYFPFDKTDTDENGILKMSPKKAYEDILEKLKKLIYPTLFLTNLKEVQWEAENESGNYSKRIIQDDKKDDISYQHIELEQKIGNQISKERLYLFNRLTQPSNLAYSVGFFIDNNGKLISKKLPAFCFFPTKETTNLNFIIHAPFLLTDSREGIHRTREHNIQLIELLAKLSADSLLILRDMNLIEDYVFLTIIPYDKSNFFEISWNYHNNKPLFFAPFYNYIKEVFEEEKLMPAKDGCVYSYDAYWPQDNSVLNLFTDEQLKQLIGDEDANWVLRNLVGNQTGKDEELKEYITDCIRECFDVSDLLRKIDADFIECQEIEWLFKLYEYLAKNNSYWSDIKTKPIFLNSERKAVPAFEKKGRDFHEILFLPSENLNSTIQTIHPDFLLNEKSNEFMVAFGIKKPSLKDEIYNYILPLYEEDGEIDTESHFKLFFKYWKDEGRPEDFLELVRDKEFVVYKTKDNSNAYRGLVDEIYYPNPELIMYFELQEDTKFLAVEDYFTLFPDENDKILIKSFFIKLGVAELPRIILSIKGSNWVNEKETKYRLDGFKNLLNKDLKFEQSLCIWNLLIKIPFNELNKLENCSKSTRPDGRYNFRTEYFISSDLMKLRTFDWLVDKNGAFVSPSKITIDELSLEYNVNKNESKHLIDFLQFQNVNQLTEHERIAIKFENEEEAEEARKALLEKREKEKRIAERKSTGTSSSINSEDLIEAIDSLENLSETVLKLKIEKDKSDDLAIFDEEGELSKGIEDLKKQLEIKKSRVDLADTISRSLKYSFDWFRAYLQLLNTYGEKQDNQKQKSISFQEIKSYKADNKYFLLCGASNYISPEIENADDFKVSIVFGQGKKENITVEGVSKKGQNLLIYCREPLSNSLLSRLSNTFKVEIKFTPAIDLLDRLARAFENKSYIDEWEKIDETIPSLNFIYGPPGTGKTTTICNDINDVLDYNPSAKFLVLTPTNKASDVICKKIQELNPEINAIRLSSPTDPELEEYGIYRDTLDDGDIQNISVVASTIHRLPYFDIQEIGLMFQYQWDYVIFDESSMIGLHYITFAIMALYKTNPDIKFIIAGDPKQIPPVVAINEKEIESFDFQDENIYKMMNLESFNPEEQKVRESDNIVNLTTQYRSVPNIGQLFSELSYSSLLKHDRAINRKESKKLPEEFEKIISSNVTFIDIPLNQEDSIYKVNKLFYSSYHTYSAILVSEIIKYFDNKNDNEQWTIGLISPYKAQAILINKLITSYGISENIKVYSDTVHGFQGDECDIVIFVCNPNNYYFSGHEKSLLSKEYIYNVAISRAKDYLLVIHPFSSIENNFFINKIGLSYKNNFGNANIVNTKTIESILFGNEKYIENNSYVSGHDNVNVFGLSDMKYFIKANDTAIDLQIRDLKPNYASNQIVDKNLVATQNNSIKIVGKIDLSKFDKFKK